jgi:hypothetical protein
LFCQFGSQEDIAAALSIAQDAADIAYAIDTGEMIDEAGSGSVDFGLPADAYATLALGYRYVVGCAETMVSPGTTRDTFKSGNCFQYVDFCAAGGPSK